MRPCILISMLCALTASGAVQPQPGFDLNDVVRQVRSAHPPASLLSPPSSLQPTDGQFLLDTTSALQPAPGGQQNAAVGFDGTNYLVVWESQLGGSYSNICGARVTPGGQVLDPSGILISDAGFERGSPALRFDGTNFLVVWQDCRRGYAYHIYGARVTPGGQVLDPTGFAISKGTNDARKPALNFDGTNFLVAWEDYNKDVDHPDIYGTRVAPDGTVLDTSDLAICTTTESQWAPAVGFDGANFMVVWSDLVDSSDEHIYGARVTPGGSVLDNNGFAISTASSLQDQPSLNFDGTNYLVTWRHVRPFVTTYIYGTRMTPEGHVLDGGTGFEIAGTGYSGSPAVSFDGANFLVAWQSVTGMAPTYFTVYGARVSPGGEVLDPDTLAIVIAPTATWAQTHPVLGFDGANYLTVWQDERHRAGEPDLYGARVTTGGGVLDPGGFIITQSARGQYAPGVAFDGTNFMAVWEDDRNGYTDIYGARVTPTGTVLDPDGIAICTAHNYQFSPAIAFDGTNYLVTWEDDRSDTTGDVYGARVTPGGYVLDPSGIAISDAPGRQRFPAVGFAGGDYLVVWEDYRSGGWDIYGTRVSPGGVVLNTDGIPISTAANVQRRATIGFDGSDYLVVWEDMRNGGSPDIYGERVTPAGYVLDPNGIAICKARDRQYSPAIAFDGTNYLIAWEDYRRSTYSDIFGTRVTPGGTVLDTAGIFLCNTSAYDKLDPAVAYDGTNFLVLWEDCCNSGKADIYGTRVTDSGALLDYGRAISQEGIQSNLAMTRGSGNHLFLVYQSWTGMVGGSTYNADRIWGDMDPTPGGGIEETPSAEPRMTNRGATIVRSVLVLPASPSPRVSASTALLDIGGRKVLDLHPGANDVHALAPGVYFVRAVSREPLAVSCQKVVLTR